MGTLMSKINNREKKHLYKPLIKCLLESSLPCSRVKYTVHTMQSIYAQPLLELIYNNDKIIDFQQYKMSTTFATIKVSNIYQNFFMK